MTDQTQTAAEHEAALLDADARDAAFVAGVRAALAAVDYGSGPRWLLALAAAEELAGYSRRALASAVVFGDLPDLSEEEYADSWLADDCQTAAAKLTEANLDWTPEQADQAAIAEVAARLLALVKNAPETHTEIAAPVRAAILAADPEADVRWLVCVALVDELRDLSSRDMAEFVADGCFPSCRTEDEANAHIAEWLVVAAEEAAENEPDLSPEAAQAAAIAAVAASLLAH